MKVISLIGDTSNLAATRGIIPLPNVDEPAIILEKPNRFCDASTTLVTSSEINTTKESDKRPNQNYTFN